MKRKALQELLDWKVNPRRKPLLMLGARQVGKTWLAREFGRREYRHLAYVRFDRDPALRAAFEQDMQVPRLLRTIQLASGADVLPGETLIVLDEIQECTAALTALKYFCEEAPEYHIIAAGSLLGVELHHGTGYPVGKVNRLLLYPLSFAEFLEATGNERFAQLLQEGDWPAMMTFRDTYEQMLRLYYYIGGMPEAVVTYLESGQFSAVRAFQLGLLSDYRADFSKHVPSFETPRLTAVWDSVPTQLAENRRFILSHAAHGAKSSAYREPIQWLCDAGLLHAAYNLKQPLLPLSGHKDEQFRLFPLDVGLLAAQSGLAAGVLVERNAVFGQFKGALTEQFVCQQLLAECGQEPYFWLAEKAQAEIDFLLESPQGVVPLEVKAEQNLRAKSLQSYCRRFRPSLAVRTSMAPYAVRRIESPDASYTLLDLPLFAVSRLRAEVESISSS